MSLRGKYLRCFTHIGHEHQQCLLKKKSVKMHSIAYQLSVKQVLSASFLKFLFCIAIIHPKKNFIKMCSPQNFHTL